ncbi:MAG: hypothetical protein NTZ78_02995 [Candidatus Aureabacteria bacterium]|nr:hypothetical protein [Candidatus Auribacterota bacterium]
MISGAYSAGLRRIHFEGNALALREKVQRPFAEKLLVRFPRIAALLAAAGAKGLPGDNRRDPGTLAAMMAASGSIGGVDKPHGFSRFSTRPISS